VANEMGEKQLFGITVAVAAVVLIFVGVLNFLSYRKYSSLQQEIEKFKKEIKAHDIVIGTRKRVKRDLEDATARFDAVKQYLPSDKEVRQLIGNFSKKCIESGLKNRKLKWVTVAGAARRPGARQKKDYESIKYECEFLGTFHSLAKFVSKVEDWKHFKRFVSITKFKMTAAQKGLAFDTGVQNHEIKMTLELYKYQAAKPAGGVTKPAAGTPVASRTR